MARRKRDVRVLDAKSLRGLAHPLRVRLLSLLRMDGPATATRLAERVGERSGTTSWHLRQLADHGFVEEDRERGNRRERWWRAVVQTTRVESEQFLDDPNLRAPLDVLLHEIVNMHYHQSTEFLADFQHWSREWIQASEMSDWWLPLTADELRQLTEDIAEVVARYTRDADNGDEDVRLQFHAFPRRRDS